MGRIVIAALMILLLAATAFAHEESAGVKHGIGPGSFLWGLDRGLENIKMLLTFDREERIRIALEASEERIAEMARMRDIGNDGLANVASDEHQHLMGRIKAQLAKYAPDDAMREYRFLEEVRAHLALHASFEDADDGNRIAETAGDVIDVIAERKERVKESALRTAGKNRDALEEQFTEIDANASDVETVSAAVEHTEGSDNAGDEQEAAEDTGDASNLITGAVVATADDLDLTIAAEIAGNETDVVVTGDLSRKFTLDITDTKELVAEIARLLEVSEDKVYDSITIEVAAAKPVISAVVEGSEITRITVTYPDGEVKTIVLAITDPAYVIKEVAKRVKMNESTVEDLITFRSE